MQEIKAAYREKVLKVHPDMQDNKTQAATAEAAARFQEVTAAYELLTNQDPELSQNRGGAAAEGPAMAARRAAAQRWKDKVANDVRASAAQTQTSAPSEDVEEEEIDLEDILQRIRQRRGTGNSDTDASGRRTFATMSYNSNMAGVIPDSGFPKVPRETSPPCYSSIFQAHRRENGSIMHW
eukprot:CAMPEP_0118930328 /NCGR_PEP_ID=MMETSP1169-20130426/7053_1 /TAXON_ID=36882 /ORGANISM="Pyramimonas obovata, Strain CCMP722" /LENGTH=180 /DNA_ID=CAMNT_0006872663 /DNA_START=21 /DNA_END=560 /DNA_ORIENTATION=+